MNDDESLFSEDESLSSEPGPAHAVTADGVVRETDWVGIGNEFTGVLVRKVWTRNGERLELNVPGKGYQIMLDAMQLEIIAAQSPEQFTMLFQRKLGSDEPMNGAL
jgi:hypothetical protein